MGDGIAERLVPILRPVDSGVPSHPYPAIDAHRSIAFTNLVVLAADTVAFVYWAPGQMASFEWVARITGRRFFPIQVHRPESRRSALLCDRWSSLCQTMAKNTAQAGRREV